MASSSTTPISWAYLNRYTYIAVRDRRIVAVAYWAPAEPGVETDIDSPHEPDDVVVMEAGYYLTRTDDPHGEWFADGPEPSGEWPEELLWAAGRSMREGGV